ncbi:ATP-binding protein [Streptomyces sp. NPDC059718]
MVHARNPCLRRARRFIACILQRWGVTERVADIILCAAELAANACEHSRPGADQFLVRVLLCQGTLRVEVHDRDPRRPAHRNPDEQASSGRGLILVRDLADGCGVDSKPGNSKAVWAGSRRPHAGTASQSRACQRCSQGGVARHVAFAADGRAVVIRRCDKVAALERPSPPQTRCSHARQAPPRRQGGACSMAAAPSSPGSVSLQGVCPIHGRAGYRSSEAVGRPLDSLHQAAPTVAWTHPEKVAPPGFLLALAGRGRSDAA